MVLDELEEIISTSKNVDESMIAEELSAALSIFVRQLDETPRRLFLRRYFYLQSVDEICFATGFTPGRVHTILHRTRNKLRAYLYEEGYL